MDAQPQRMPAAVRAPMSQAAQVGITATPEWA